MLEYVGWDENEGKNLIRRRPSSIYPLYLSIHLVYNFWSE